MDTEKYRLLLKIAEYRNITKASKAMDYTQSAASHAISSMEEELGLRLLQRNHSGTFLTPDGSMLLPYVQEIVRSEDRFRTLADSIRSMQKGDLKIGAFTSIAMVCLPRIIAQFHQQYPNIRVEIFSGDGSYDDLEHFLLCGLVDCSFVCQPVSPGLSCIDLFEDPLNAVLPAGHPFARQEGPITLEQLKSIPFLMPPEGNNTDILRLCRQYGFTPNVAFTMPDDFSLLAMVENGMGCTILPNLILSNYKHSAVVRQIEGVPCRTVSFATRASDPLSQRAKALIRLIHDSMKPAGVRMLDFQAP